MGATMRILAALLPAALAFGCAAAPQAGAPTEPLSAATPSGTTRVRVVAIGQGSPDGFRWWQPDGTPLAAGPAEVATVWDAAILNRPRRRGGDFMVIAEADPVAPATRPQGSFRPAEAETGGRHARASWLNFWRGHCIGSGQVQLPVKHHTTTIDYTYHTGEFEKVASLMPAMRTAFDPEVGAETSRSINFPRTPGYTITEPATVGGGSVVATVGPSIDQLVARKPGGEVVQGELLQETATPTGALQTWRFPPLRTADVAEFEAQREKRAGLRFAGVSLKPGRRTVPTVEPIAPH